MKRILGIFMALCILAISSVASAYPLHLNGDSNYILVDGHMGVGFYLDRSSLVVKKYAPPQYIIAANIVSAVSADGTENGLYNGGWGKIDSVRTMAFFYNWDLREMYVDSTGGTNWRYLNPNGSWAETGVSMPAGEMAFYLAYDMKFYGSRKFYDSSLKDYYCPFDSTFYTAAQ